MPQKSPTLLTSITEVLKRRLRICSCELFRPPKLCRSPFFRRRSSPMETFGVSAPSSCGKRPSSWHLLECSKRPSYWPLLECGKHPSAWPLLECIKRPSSWPLLESIKRPSSWPLLECGKRPSSWTLLDCRTLFCLLRSGVGLLCGNCPAHAVVT